MEDVAPPPLAQENEPGCIAVTQDVAAPEPGSPSSPSRKTRRQKSSSSASTSSESNTEVSLAESDVVREEDHVAPVVEPATLEIVDDLISLPSPVAASSTSVFDAFATPPLEEETQSHPIAEDSTIEVVTEVMDRPTSIVPEHPVTSPPKDPVVLDGSNIENPSSVSTAPNTIGSAPGIVGTSVVLHSQATSTHQDVVIQEVTPQPVILSAAPMDVKNETKIPAESTSSTDAKTTDTRVHQELLSTEAQVDLKPAYDTTRAQLATKPAFDDAQAQLVPSSVDQADESNEEQLLIQPKDDLNFSADIPIQSSTFSSLDMKIEVSPERTNRLPPKSINKTVSSAPSKSPVTATKRHEKLQKVEVTSQVIDSTKPRPTSSVRSQSESKSAVSKPNYTPSTLRAKSAPKVAVTKAPRTEVKSDAIADTTKSRARPNGGINGSKNGPPLAPSNGNLSFGPPPAPAKLGVAPVAEDSSTTIETESVPKKRLSSSEIDAAANRLYADANESKKRKDALRAELTETYSFAPQVNPSKRRNSNSGGDPTKSRFEQLHERGKDALRRKETKVTAGGNAKECTFRPAITAKARRLSKAKVNDRPRYENLYRNAQEIKQKREGRRQEAERSAVEECSFKPKIKTVKSPIPSRPLYDAEREKQKKLDREQKKVDTELSACTFKPKVTKKAAVSAKQSEEQLFDRLYHADQERKERMEKRRQEHDEQEKALTPFQPQLASSTVAHIKSVEKQARLQQPFHERLFSKDHLQQVEHEREQRRLEEERRFSFKPQITPVPDEIKAKLSAENTSPGKSIFSRLYEEKDKIREKFEQCEELKAKQEMAECTFKPQIEKEIISSDSQSPTGPIWERLASFDKNQVIEDRERLKEQLELLACTFKPDITPLDSFSSPKKSPRGSIFERLSGCSTSLNSTPEDQKRAQVHTRSQSMRVSSKPSHASDVGSSKSTVGDILKLSQFMLSLGKASGPESSNYSKSLPNSLQAAQLKNRGRSSMIETQMARSTSKENNNGETRSSSITKGYASASSSPRKSIARERRSSSVTRSLAAEFSEEAALRSHSKSIVENYDSWAANLEAKMQSL